MPSPLLDAHPWMILQTPSAPPTSGDTGSFVAEAATTAAFTLAGTLILATVTAIWLNTRMKRTEALIAKRLEVFDVIAGEANTIVQFYNTVGDWRLLTPESVIAAKRAVDRSMAVHGALFSTPVHEAYRGFMETFFGQWRGPGLDAGLRIDPDKLKDRRGAAVPTDWSSAFAEPPHPGRDERTRAYQAFTDALGRDVGIRKPPVRPEHDPKRDSRS
ncbi:hypothetical protein ABZ477_16110 [Microbacterium sp. NPDC019599]|uniref:hypothetical protein n=1 Tax=Microbacterium sp. NPDC019599 TaxID=3154690 RepID=UPI0034034FA3